MSELIILSGKLKGKRLVLPPKAMIVGRDEDCDLRIASSLVSRKHCSLFSTPDGIQVTDLKSQNGTHVNDVPITEPILLREGDILRIGATVLAVPSSMKIKLPPDNSSAISESEIADWLTEPGPNDPGSDTAVIKMPPNELRPTPSAESKPHPATTASPVKPASPAPIPGTKPVAAKPLTIKEEAAEVIRKHWEKIKATRK